MKKNHKTRMAFYPNLAPLALPVLGIMALPSHSSPVAITNAGFETDSAPIVGATGWTIASGGTDWFTTTAGAPDSPVDPEAAFEGTNWLSGNRLATGAGSSSDPQTIVQLVDISGESEQVDSGAALVSLDFMFADNDPNDDGTVNISFFSDVAGTIPVGTDLTTGIITPTAPGPGGAANWEARELTGPVPPSARSLQIEIVNARTGGGSAGNVHFDNFSAWIGEEDSDNDGLPDSYEQTIIDFDPDDAVTELADVMGTGASPIITDFDGDGSNDADEFDLGTDPVDPDSDDDGLEDGVETNTGDYNGPSDAGTDPLDPDYDFDGFTDGDEVLFGSSPVDETSLPGTEVTITNPSFETPVLEFFSEGVPVSGGTVTGWSVVTNEMWVIDSFDTGSAADPAFASEGSQFLTSGRQAPNPDALPEDFVGGNAATMSASQDVDVSSFAADIDAGTRTILVNFDWFDNDVYDTGKVTVHFLDGSGNDLGRYRTGVTTNNPDGWQTTTLPVYPPALTRTVRITLTGDNFNDAGEPSGVGTVRNAHFDNVVARLAYVDSDLDQMADDWELDNGLDPDDSSDAGNHDDDDTLDNLAEFRAGTNPRLSDTDGDSYNDDVELTAGSDPLDAASVPAALAITSVGFDGSGSFEVAVSGLIPTKTYRMLRGTDLLSFPDEVDSQAAAGTSGVFTDAEPLTGTAFYIVEEVESAP